VSALGLSGNEGRKERAYKMGVLTVATPVKWEESIKHLPYVREHGVLQFMENYK
jgi:hypothetical protein